MSCLSDRPSSGSFGVEASKRVSSAARETVGVIAREKGMVTTAVSGGRSLLAMTE